MNIGNTHDDRPIRSAALPSDLTGNLLLSGDERAVQEKLRGDQEKRRGDQEKIRADQEAERADRLAEKLRELGINPESL